jgi:hypothetical protein
MWNSVLSTVGARYMCLDIKNFYLTTPLHRYEYENTIKYFPRMDYHTMRFEQTRIKWFHLPGNELSSVGPPTGRHTCQ